MTSLNFFLSGAANGTENVRLSDIRIKTLRQIVFASAFISTLSFVLLLFTATTSPTVSRIAFWLISQTILWSYVFFIHNIPHLIGSNIFFFALYLIATVEFYSLDGIFVGALLLLFIPFLALILISFRAGLFYSLVAIIIFAASPNFFVGIDSVGLLSALNEFTGPLSLFSFLTQIILFLAVSAGMIYAINRYRNLVLEASVERDLMIHEINETQNILEMRIESRIKTILASTTLNQEISNILGEHGLARTVAERIVAENKYAACQLFFIPQYSKNKRIDSIYQTVVPGFTLPSKTISLDAEPYASAIRKLELQVTYNAPHLDVSPNNQVLQPDHNIGEAASSTMDMLDHYAELPVAIMPIFSGKEVSGLMIIYRHPDEIFTQDDRFFIKTVASQIAISLRNAKVYQRATRFAQNELIVQSLFEKLQNVNSIPEALKISAAFIGNHLEKDVKLSVGVNPNNPFQK